MKNKSGLLSSIFGHAMLIVNCFVTIWLLLCLAASFISPVRYHHLPLFSLTTPFAILANIFFVFFWLFSRKKLRIILPLLTLAICYKLIIVVFGFNFFGSNDMSRHSNSLKIMSWNVHGLGVFDKHNDDIPAKIRGVIKKEQPDILCMAEYAVFNNDSTTYSNLLKQDNHFREYKFNMDNTLGKKAIFGDAFFSKYPILHFQVIKVGISIYLLQSDVQLPDGKIMRFCFIHLYSFNLSDKDRKYFSTLKATKKIGRTDLQYSRFYAAAFAYSYEERAFEADTIADILSKSPYPVFICGDFNDLPGSYTYTTIRGKLCDAFLEKGKGFGRTYNQIFTTLRIDHMLYDSSYLHVIGFKAPYTNLSDHNPIIGNFILKNAAR